MIKSIIINSKTVRLYYDDNIYKLSPLKLNSKQKHYIFNVMRRKNGTLFVFNNKCEWICEINNGSVTPMSIIRTSDDIRNDLIIAPCIIKSKRLQILVEKITEIGIKKIFPIISNRSLQDVNLDRMKSWAIEAIEQSNQMTIPEIIEPIKLNKINGFIKDHNIIVLNQFSNISIKEIETDKTNIIIIGPEGGFDESEISFLKKFHNISISNNILRSETAAIIASQLFLNYQ